MHTLKNPKPVKFDFILINGKYNWRSSLGQGLGTGTNEDPGANSGIGEKDPQPLDSLLLRCCPHLNPVAVQFSNGPTPTANARAACRPLPTFRQRAWGWASWHTASQDTHVCLWKCLDTHPCDTQTESEALHQQRITCARGSDDN